ncbi:hypothetical protein DFJ74DRAFT_655783 [Hyaloraphidium curvatum]|nr:hypothetical protein DFJ74DRAFT_655783 [Hyaloraphidium curvatum]
MAAPNLVGTYKLYATRASYSDGTPAPPPFGATATGVAMLTATRVMFCVTDGSDGPMPPLQRPFMAYTGRYRCDGRSFVTGVDGTSDLVNIRGEQARDFTIEDGRMVLSQTKIVNGRSMKAEFVWEKVAA